MNRIALLSAILLTGAALAQHQHSPAPTGKPIILYPGLGTWTHPIATKNREAQQFFDQGLILLYGFNRPDALRSFQKAAELDPKAAMPHWGISMAMGPYLNMDMDPDVHIKEACEAADKGLAIQGISDTDRAWLNTAKARCPDFSDPGKYIAAMRDLAARFPDDPDAQTLYAEAIMVRVRWRWYSSDGKPADGMHDAEQTLESVLRRHPSHPGANHFYIHAVESSPTPERAVPSAQRLMGIVPAAGHMVHMPGHIWLVLGDFDNCVAVNERAAEVYRLYFEKLGLPNSYFPYYLHNLHFIVHSRAMQGRSADTLKAMAKMEAAVKPVAAAIPEMAGMVASVVMQAQLRLHRWDDILASPQPPDPMSQSFWRMSRALAQAGKGKLAEASKELAEFETVRAKVDRNIVLSVNKLGEVLDLASAVITARVQATPAAAVPKWQRAVELQDALAYDEPPAWYYPIRESLGAAILQSGDAKAAEAVFREGLKRSPRNGRMLFGLLESLKAQGKSADAAWVQRELDAAWKGADVKLTIKDL